MPTLCGFGLPRRTLFKDFPVTPLYEYHQIVLCYAIFTVFF